MIIKNAIIYDGSDNIPFTGAIYIENGSIDRVVTGKTQLATIEDSMGENCIDCCGELVVCPGFIDVHSHSDFSLFYDPSQKEKLFQGVTTDICGNCGISPSPFSSKYFELLKSYTAANGSTRILTDEKWKLMNDFEAYLRAIEKLELKINVGCYVGHGTIRLAVMGMENREASIEELEEMKNLVRESMEAGALGMTSGLIYPPGVYSKTEEMIELCKVVHEYDGVYATHMRNESVHLLDSIKETICVAEKSNVKTLISHYKAVGQPSYKLPTLGLKLINEARSRGVRIKLDQYPYTACSTSLMTAIPPKYHEGGVEALLELLKSIQAREEITQSILVEDDSWDNIYKEAGFRNLLIISAENTSEAIGKSVQEFSDINNIDGFSALYDLLLKNNCSIMCVEFAMSEDNIRTIMQYEHTMIGSDSGAVFKDMKFHPRTTGSFPRILGKYVREEGVLDLKTAIKKMTSLPAEFLNIKNKGYIKEGYDADLVIFNPKEIMDCSTFTEPEIAPIGIKYVFVNGQMAVKDNVIITENTVGRLIRRF